MINWKEIPFVKFLLPFAAGILLANYLDAPHPIWYIFLSTFILVRFGLLFKKIPLQYGWIHGLVANGLLFFIGYILCLHHSELHSTKHFQQHISKANIVIGEITAAPKVGKYIKVTLATKNIGTQLDSLQTCDGNLLVYLKNDSLRQLNYGDIIAIKGNIQKVDAPKNPHAFDYRRYLHYQNIHYQSFVNQPVDWEMLAGGQGGWVNTQALGLRTYFLRILEKHLTTPNELAVGNALILGYKDDLDEEVRTAYAHTGALHVLAVSGLHVGLVAWFVSLLLDLIRLRSNTWKFIKAFLLIGVVWSFALVAGGAPSVLRSATMFSFLIFGLSLHRTTNIYNSLAISATFLLLWNPYLLFNVSFQLSYSALIGIIYFQPKIFAAWYVKPRLGNFFWRLITVTLGAQIGTLPISLYYFHAFPMYGWLSGIVVIPAATVILGSGMALLFIETVLPMLSFIPAGILYYSIWLMNAIIFLIQKLPLSVWAGIWIGLGVVFLMYAMIGNIVLALSTKKLNWLLPAAFFFCIISINYSFASFSEIEQKKLVIYHSRKHTIIDFFDGKKGVSFSNKEISSKNLSFATQNNRWANGIKELQQIPLDTTSFMTDHLMFQKPFFQFHDKKILLLDDTFQFRDYPPIEVDFILIRNNPKIDFTKLTEHFTFHKIIFDASNSQWKVNKWKTACQKLDIPYYDIYENGAFELSLE